MRISRSRVVTTAVLAATAASLIAVVSCYTPTEPYYTDIDGAHEVWLASHPLEYTFDVASATSWFPKSGYTHVEVSDGVVVAATDPDGRPIEGYSRTVDTLWTRILTARASGELNSALFDWQGVPVEADWGEWASDGGVHYWVQNFVKLR